MGAQCRLTYCADRASCRCTDFFDGKHFVLRGASSVTDPAMRRDSFRNFYQKQYPHVFAKFRLCYNAAAS